MVRPFSAVKSWTFVKNKEINKKTLSGEYVEKVNLIIVLLKVRLDNGEGPLNSSFVSRRRLLPEELTCMDEPSTWQVEEGAGDFQW